MAVRSDGRRCIPDDDIALRLHAKKKPRTKPGLLNFGSDGLFADWSFVAQ